MPRSKIRDEEASCIVNDPWFGHIVSGMKRVEGRLHRGTFSRLRAGDALVVRNKGAGSGRTRSFRARVVDVRRYPGFREYLEAEGLRNALPGVPDVTAGIAVYRAFYSEADEAAHGVVAVELERAPTPAASRLVEQVAAFVAEQRKKPKQAPPKKMDAAEVLHEQEFALRSRARRSTA